MQSNLSVQSAKVLLLPPKYEIIMVSSNHSFFQLLRQQYWTFLYWFLVKLSLLILFTSFFVSVLCFFFMTLFLKLSLFQLSRQRQLSLFFALKGDSDKITVTFRDSDSCRSFSLLKAIAIRLPLLFANTFKSVKERKLFGRAITIWGAIQKRSHEPIYKILSKEIRATTFAIAKLEEQ